MDKQRGGVRFAGGRPIASIFGTFAGRNITPDPVAGIGRFNGAKLAGPGNKPAPTTTPDPADRIGRWSAHDVATRLKTGITAEGDVVAAPMSEIVDGTARLTDADRRAIALHLKSPAALPAKGERDVIPSGDSARRDRAGIGRARCAAPVRVGWRGRDRG